jgi:hypothetical protein
MKSRSGRRRFANRWDSGSRRVRCPSDCERRPDEPPHTSGYPSVKTLGVSRARSRNWCGTMITCPWESCPWAADRHAIIATSTATYSCEARSRGGHRLGEFAHTHRMCGRSLSRPFVNNKQGRVAVSSRRGHDEQQCQPNEEGEHTGVDGESTAEVVSGWPYRARPSLAAHRCHVQPPVPAPSGASRREHRLERRRARWYIRLRYRAPVAQALGSLLRAQRRSPLPLRATGHRFGG